MPDKKQEYEYKLINLITQQLNQVYKLHGYSVKRLVIERDFDGDYGFTIDSELLSGR